MPYVRHVFNKDNIQTDTFIYSVCNGWRPTLPHDRHAVVYIDWSLLAENCNIVEVVEPLHVVQVEGHNDLECLTLALNPKIRILLLSQLPLRTNIKNNMITIYFNKSGAWCNCTAPIEEVIEALTKDFIK